MSPLFPPPPPPTWKIPREHPLDPELWRRLTWGLVVNVLAIAKVLNPDRRRSCRTDFLKFCLTYFPAIFWNPNRFHREFAAELQALMLAKAPTLMLKALAAPRGIGKTTVCLLFILWATIYGHSKFAIVLCDNAGHAEERMLAIKSLVLSSDLLMEDFPEICGPVREFGGDARAAAGTQPDYPWSKDEVRLANGAWIAAYGMDSGIAGRLKNFQRPDLILVDDAETVDSVKSPTETRRLHDRLYQEVMKLPGQGAPAVLTWICTIKARGCLSDQLTDRALNPEWRGSRYAALTEPPKADLFWNHFMEKIKPADRPVPVELPGLQTASALEVLCIPPDAWKEYTPERQAALEFYAAHKAEMDEGAVCLDGDRLPLHQIMYERSILGERAWLCELQQDPPRDENVKDLQLEIELLARRAVGEKRGVVPPWAAWILVTLDMGRHRCHWQADAWDADFRTSCLIDQGWLDTNLNRGGEYQMTDDEAKRTVMVQQAVQFALESAHRRFAEGWPRADSGEIVRPRAIGVDCGGTAERFAWYETVLRFCARQPNWIALKGSDWRERTADRALGRNWICEEKGNPGRRHDCNADEYKTRVFQALAAPVWKVEGLEHFPGARYFHCECPREYMRHMTSEKYVEVLLKPETVSGKEYKIGWNHVTSIPNHWWDTSWMNYALADICRHRGVHRPAAPKPDYRPRETGGGASKAGGWKIGR